MQFKIYRHLHAFDIMSFIQIIYASLWLSIRQTFENEYRKTHCVRIMNFCFSHRLYELNTIISAKTKMKARMQHMKLFYFVWDYIQCDRTCDLYQLLICTIPYKWYTHTKKFIVCWCRMKIAIRAISAYEKCWD